MKLLTHYVFSTGLLALAATSMGAAFPSALFISLITSVMGNSIIDGLGHEERGGYVRRTPLTHTVPRSIAWGAVPGIIISLLLAYGSQWRVTPLAVIVLLSNLLLGPSHMFLDAFTERGIYVKRRGRWVRFAIAHISYGNSLANGAAMIVGSLMLFAAFSVH
ncbi:DUF1286 domain-containing protein [Thermocladium modestius]|uniref:DUF1286 domain-containing protein n=1 Tax=Thermocladium modestius TaxID=62609 RepID=UPI001663C858